MTTKVRVITISMCSIWLYILQLLLSVVSVNALSTKIMPAVGACEFFNPVYFQVLINLY